MIITNVKQKLNNIDLTLTKADKSNAVVDIANKQLDTKQITS